MDYDVPLQDLTRRVEALERTYNALSVQLTANTALTQSIAMDTADIRVVFNDARAAFGLFRRLMWFTKTILMPLAAVIALVYFIATGHAPAWFVQFVK